MEYMDDRLGFVDVFDHAWIMNDFGTLIKVPFCIPYWYWQDTEGFLYSYEEAV